MNQSNSKRIRINMSCLYESFRKTLSVSALIGCTALSQQSLAEGSRDLYPTNDSSTKGYRIFLNARTGTGVSSAAFDLFPNMGRQLVYAIAGETIHMGSSVAGLRAEGSTLVGSITLKSPTGVVLAELNTYNPSSGYGRIENRSEELAGPKIGSKTTGYDPLSFTVSQTGIYEVTFGALGTGTTIPSTAFYPANTSTWSQPLASTASAMIVAWDVTVTNTANEELTGRVYMNVFNGSGPNGMFNNRTFFPTFYVLTPQSWVYEVNNNGQNGASFNFFSNNKGPRATTAANAAPLYGSLQYSASDISPIFSRIWDPRGTESDGNYTNKIFYNQPDLVSFPATAPVYYSGASTPIASTTWLKGEPVTPEILGVVAKCGGVIRFLSNINGHYQILIDGNSDGLYNSPADRILNGNAKFGENEVVWDGKDGLGNNITSGSITVDIRVTTGEVHFPFVDVEANDSGIVISRLGSTGNDTVYWNDNGMTISTNQKAPSPMINHSGISSTTNGHRWSTTATTYTEANYFGNNKLLDTWTFVFDEATITFNYFTCLEIKGRVWHDLNGDGNSTGEQAINGINAGSGQKLGDTLYVYLLDSNDVILDRAIVNADGTYTLSNVPRNENGLKISISTALEYYTNTFSGPQLPPTWTGATETIGFGNTATQKESGDLYIDVKTTTSNLLNQNFGIQQAPIATADTLAPQLNPNGDSSIVIPNNSFIYEDFNGGTVKSLIITTFPDNTTSITVGDTTYYNPSSAVPTGCTTCAIFPDGGIVIDINPSTKLPDQAIAIDPIDGSVNAIIPFTVIDNAGVSSIDTTTLTIPFIGNYTISGDILNDINGLSNNTIDGTPISEDLNLKAYLIDSNGIVVGITNVIEGTYTFEQVLEGTYSIILSSDSTTTIVNGDLASSIVVSLPSNWTTIGENIGSEPGHDNVPNGIITDIVISNSNVEDANFAIKEIPVATTDTISAPINNTGGSIDISDLIGGEEPNGIDIDSLHISNFPSNATTITIGTETYYDPSNPPSSTTGMTPFPSTGITIPTDADGTPQDGFEISIDPEDGNTEVTLTFTVIDEAGINSEPTDFLIPFQSVYNVSGNVIIDANGLTDGLINGEPLQDNIGLYAVLLNELNEIIDYVLIDTTDGSYTFNQVIPGNYHITITANTLTEDMKGVDASTVLTTTLPAGWIVTGEANAGILDDNINGTITDIIVSNKDVENVNFGIQELPVSLAVNLSILGAPKVGVPVVLSNPLSGYDNEDTDGDTVSWSSQSIVIHTLPTNGFILTYNGKEVAAGDTINNYDPTLLTIEPSATTLEGVSNTTFTYSVIDEAGFTSLLPATYTVSYEEPLPVNILSLDVYLHNAIVKIHWTTEQEKYTDYFEVEKSTNGIEWTTIATIASNNALDKAQAVNHYAYDDVHPYQGKNMYRIKEVAKDRSSQYSAVKYIDVHTLRNISIYPNPTYQDIIIEGLSKGDKITIINALGTIVYQSISESAKTKIDCSTLPAGNYTIQIMNDQQVYNNKFTKLK